MYHYQIFIVLSKMTSISDSINNELFPSFIYDFTYHNIFSSVRDIFHYKSKPITLCHLFSRIVKSIEVVIFEASSFFIRIRRAYEYRARFIIFKLICVFVLNISTFRLMPLNKFFIEVTPDVCSMKVYTCIMPSSPTCKWVYNSKFAAIILNYVFRTSFREP